MAILLKDSSEYSTTTATPTKTSLENISSRHLHYFAIIPIRSLCAMWPNYPEKEQVRTGPGKGLQVETENERLTVMCSQIEVPLCLFLYVMWSCQDNSGMISESPENEMWEDVIGQRSFRAVFVTK